MHRNSEMKTAQSGCSAVGSVLRSGRRGQEFESLHSDKITPDIFIKPLKNSGFFVYNPIFTPFFYLSVRRFTSNFVTEIVTHWCYISVTQKQFRKNGVTFYFGKIKHEKNVTP